MNLDTRLLNAIKGRVHVFFIRDVPPLGESSLIAFFWGAPNQLITLGAIDNVGCTPKNATLKNFTSTDFLGPIRFDSPNGGTFNSRIKNVNSPFKLLVAKNVFASHHNAIQNKV